MKKLDKRDNTVIDFEPNEGERTLLSSNKGSTRSPSLDLGATSNSTKDELVSILAKILVEGFLWYQEHGKQQTQQSSDLLSSIDKGTS